MISVGYKDIAEPKRGKRNWTGKLAERDAVYANRRGTDDFPAQLRDPRRQKRFGRSRAIQ
jgi:hypothetical protein